jgi:hypothetical protein
VIKRRYLTKAKGAMRQNDPLFEQFVGRWLPFPFVAEHSQLPDISPNQLRIIESGSNKESMEIFVAAAMIWSNRYSPHNQRKGKRLE